MNSTNSGY
jgi:hypothetical protein